jgi:predicted DNA-binding protein (MmcQ/YjbR family)
MTRDQVLDKRHWNTVDLNGTIDAAELGDMIKHSYDLVVSRLPKHRRARLPGV